jgi:hypothetical protein
MVESMMGDIIDERSCRLNVATYESIQTVKYKLASRKKSAIKYFQRKDKLRSAIDSRVCRSITTAYSHYKAELEEKRKVAKAAQQKLDLETKKTIVRKQQAKSVLQKAEKHSFLAHSAKQERLGET